MLLDTLISLINAKKTSRLGALKTIGAFLLVSNPLRANGPTGPKSLTTSKDQMLSATPMGLHLLNK